LGVRCHDSVEALLRGLIYDDRGNIMSPSYGIRRGNRYRYYVSSALLRDRVTRKPDMKNGAQRQAPKSGRE
jgi:hypothetical protein